MQNDPFQTNGYCILDHIQIIVINNLYCIDFFKNMFIDVFLCKFFFKEEKKDEQKRITKIKKYSYQ